MSDTPEHESEQQAGRPKYSFVSYTHVTTDLQQLNEKLVTNARNVATWPGSHLRVRIVHDRPVCGYLALANTLVSGRESDDSEGAFRLKRGLYG